MNLKKYAKLSLAVALGMTVSANAAEVYNNNDGDTLDIYGEFKLDVGNTKIDANHTRYNLSNNSSRFGLKGGKVINSDLKGVMHIEWGFDPLASEAVKGDIFNNRLSYLGMESNKYGTFLAGKQWSVYYDIAGWTDVYEGTGGEVLNVYEGASGGFTGRGRADDALTYHNSFKDLTIGVQAQGYAVNNAGSGLNEGELNRNSGAGASLVYDLTKTLKVGASYYFTELQASNTLMSNLNNYSTSDYNQQAGIVGIQYVGSKIDLAVNVSQSANAIRFGETSTGIESYLAYKYRPDGSHIYVGSNTMIGNVDEDTTNTDINYVAIGFLHSLMDDTSFYFYGEYRYDLRSDEDKAVSDSASVLDVTGDMSQYRLGIKYVF